MKSKSTLIVWGLLQLAVGVILHEWAGKNNLNEYLIWFGILNLVMWFFIGQSSSAFLKNKRLDGMLAANFFANLVGILSFVIYYFGILKDTVLHTYSQRYFFPMIEMTSDVLKLDILSRLFRLDRVFLVALLLQMLVFAIGYLVRKR